MATAPLEVLLLIDDLHEWTGTEVHLLRLMEHLPSDQVRARLAVVGRAGLAEAFRARGLSVETLGLRRTLAPEGLVGIARIAALLRRQRARVLVTYHTAADLLGPLAGVVAGVPVLSCRRDEGFTKKPVHVQLQRRLNRLLAGMIAVSHPVVRAVERTEGFPAARTQVIWNGEDLRRFSPGPSTLRTELGLGPDTLVIGSVALLSPIKDHACQIRAISILSQKNPNSCLVVTGDGPLRQALEDQAAPLGDRVRFLGHRDDVDQVLRGCDLLVQTSLSEGFSNTLLQGMACGLPVVATAVGGNLELVTPDCGILVPAGDPEAVAQALARLAADASLRQRLGASARRRVEQHCSVEVMTRRYCEAFRRAASGRFPGAPLSDLQGS